MSAVERHRVRTVLALGLMAVYYGAIICVPATLFAVSVIDWLKGSGRLSLVFGSSFVGVTILWTLFPRLERFYPPGPRIDRSSQPEILAAIEEVAAASGQPVPREIYLTMELNAGVAEHGGLLGFGSRRAIGRSLEVFDDSMLRTPFTVYGSLGTADLPERARLLGDEIARELPATAAHDERGHRLEGGVGQPMVFRNLDRTATPVTIDPFESMCALSEGRLGGSEWDSICRAFRIDTLALEPVAAARRIGQVAHANGAPE